MASHSCHLYCIGTVVSFLDPTIYMHTMCYVIYHISCDYVIRNGTSLEIARVEKTQVLIAYVHCVKNGDSQLAHVQIQHLFFSCVLLS